ncbi:MAG: DUF1631 domain-containing protein [Pseudomonadales bacterium]|nr:DUF1631 domain-containing protein [Pseudomonadales bacterium]
MDVTDAKGQSTPSSTALPVSPALVDNIATRAVASLCACLTDMYEHIDDTLFDLADRAHNNQEQSLYFESMREIRMHRKSAEMVFKQSVENSFQRLRDPAAQFSSHEDLEAETLALVDNDEMEVEVAINTMVHRARCEFPAALLQLSMRLNTFLTESCNEDSLPLDPKQIVKAFSQSVQDIELDIKIRIILFKEFEKYVLRHLDEMLFDANEILIQANILPDIRASITRSQQKAKAQEAQDSDSNSESDITESTESYSSANDTATTTAPLVQFDTLQSLLSATQNLQAQSVYIQADPEKPGLDKDHLMDWLSDLQKQQLSQQLDEEIPTPVTVREEIFDILKKRGTDDPHNRLHKVDDNVINVVDMIFEFILDQDIPSPMAALIGRLQIPILKVAIRDQAFFDSHKHPARRLLNEIAHASLGWDAKTHYKKDPLYKMVEETVHTILKTEHPTIELFEGLEKNFNEYVEGEEKRSEKLAQRTAAAEEGKAKTEANKKLIAQLIRDRIHGKELPPVVIDFLNKPWQTYLLQVASKAGSDSDAWKAALKTADDLIWSVQMHTEPDARRRWMELIPTLLDSITGGLEKISHSPAETDKTISALWEIHSKMLKHKGNENPVETVKVDLTHVVSPAVISPLMKRKLPPEQVRELRQFVSALEEGGWFEFTQRDGNKISCKLIRKIRANDSFVFANRYGAKAKAVTKDQLALYIHDEKARLLDSGPLIDRAMQAVMIRLKNSLP